MSVQRHVGDAVIEVVEGDITKETVDAIVNAANKTLMGGGGVDGAIHKAGGPEIRKACEKLGGCDIGDAKITTGGALAAKYVIHTVGPVYANGRKGEPEALESCYRRSLEVALENGVTAIAFPAISCGVYRYPLEEAAQIAVETVAAFLEDNPEIALVRFVLFSEDVYEAFETALHLTVRD